MGRTVRSDLADPRLLPLRVALLVGVADAAVALATAGLSRPHVASLVVGVLWLAAWTVGGLRAPAVAALLRRRPWAAAALGVAGMGLAALDGGYPGNLATQPQWLVLVAAAALPWRVAVVTGIAVWTAKCGTFWLTDSGPAPIGHAGHPEARSAALLPLLLIPTGLVGRAAVRRLAEIAAEARAGVGGRASPLAAATASGPPRPAPAAAPEPPPPLTPAQREVVALLAAGRVPKEIAAERGTSLQTVRTQIKLAKRRTGARTLDELVRVAVERRDG